VFFFSSRRRHTRFSRDWSSDVCSSDLENDLFNLGDENGKVALGFSHSEATGWESNTGGRGKTEAREVGVVETVLLHERLDTLQRSEERRVGKECRSRWSTDK